MSRELDMSRLTTELTDFLDLPEALDLPAVQSVQCKRAAHGTWQVRAFLTATSDDARYRAMSQWAAFAGGSVEISEPYPATHQPSRTQRTLTLRIVVAEVPIELTACVDGLFTAPTSVQAVAS